MFVYLLRGVVCPAIRTDKLLQLNYIYSEFSASVKKCNIYISLKCNQLYYYKRLNVRRAVIYYFSISIMKRIITHLPQISKSNPNEEEYGLWYWSRDVACSRNIEFAWPLICGLSCPVRRRRTYPFARRDLCVHTFDRSSLPFARSCLAWKLVARTRSWLTDWLMVYICVMQLIRSFAGLLSVISLTAKMRCSDVRVRLYNGQRMGAWLDICCLPVYDTPMRLVCAYLGLTDF